LKLTAALVLALMVPAGLRAQQPPAPVRVQGAAFDSLSRTPIAHAPVQFVRENGDPGMTTATSGADGSYRACGIPANTQTVAWTRGLLRKPPP
jgi:hypothetical protein